MALHEIHRRTKFHSLRPSTFETILQQKERLIIRMVPMKLLPDSYLISTKLIPYFREIFIKETLLSPNSHEISDILDKLLSNFR